MCDLAPMLYCQLSYRYSPQVVATDASMQGFGVVAMHMSAVEQAEMKSARTVDVLWQRQRTRAITGRDPADVKADTDIWALQKQFERSPLSDWLQRRGRHGRWATIVNTRWRHRDVRHINELEARAVKTAVVWLRSRRDAYDCHVTLLTDSAVVAAALQRGRSSARALCLTVRAIAGHLLAGGLTPAYYWIPTHVNPADFVSRHFA